MLSLRWGSPTDIWSFGKTVCDLNLHYFMLMAHIISLTLLQLISLIWGLGWHIFKPDPKDAEPDDDAYPNHILVKQIAYFGPFPRSYFDILPEDDERWEYIGDATQYIIDNQKWKPFAMAEDKELAEEDRTIICKNMKLDPRDRPTAKELLQDPWLKDVYYRDRWLFQKLDSLPKITQVTIRRSIILQCSTLGASKVISQ
jgi:casein kinase II subunit alpha